MVARHELEDRRRTDPEPVAGHKDWIAGCGRDEVMPCRVGRLRQVDVVRLISEDARNLGQSNRSGQHAERKERVFQRVFH